MVIRGTVLDYKIGNLLVAIHCIGFLAKVLHWQDHF